MRCCSISSAASTASASARRVRGLGVHDLGGRQRAQVHALLDQAAQVAVGEDAQHAAGIVDHGGGAQALGAHLAHQLGKGRCRPHTRGTASPCASRRSHGSAACARARRPGASGRSPRSGSRAHRAGPRPARRPAPSARWCWRWARGSAGRPPSRRRCRARCRHGGPGWTRALPVIATSGTPRRLSTGRMTVISSLSPPLEMASTRSPP
jgi:hypothetical protein